VGLSARIADSEVLKRLEYFGKFGKIIKVIYFHIAFNNIRKNRVVQTDDFFSTRYSKKRHSFSHSISITLRSFNSFYFSPQVVVNHPKEVNFILIRPSFQANEYPGDQIKATKD